MKKSIGFVSLFVAFVLTSGLSIIFFNNFLTENSDKVRASVVLDGEKVLRNDNLRTPVGNLCDPFCIVEKLDKSDLIFEDLDFSHKNAFAINKFYENGLIKGYSDGTFKPNDKMNRVEVLTVVLDSIDADFSSQFLDNCFSDVKNEWFSAYVCYAKNHNIVSGFTDGSFKPSSFVTRSEALKITLEALGFDKNDYNPDSELKLLDISSSDWVVPYLYLAQNANIVSKTGRFGGNNHITRAEFIQLIYNAMIYRGLLE